jgi:hypothetical protein
MTRTILSIVLAAACLLGAEAQVRVRVRDGDSGQWLAGARVKVGDRVFFTDSVGECIIPAVAGRRLLLTTLMNGCFTATDSVLATVPDARLVVRLYGTQPRTAIGFVRDGRTGKPLARALVRVKSDPGVAKTDSAGMYVIPFPPGDRELIAGLPEVKGRVEVQGFGAACGANVTVEGTRLGTASDQNGDYVITGVPAGTCRVVFSYAGCKKTMKVVGVRAWESLVVNVRLEQRLPTIKQ